MDEATEELRRGYRDHVLNFERGSTLCVGSGTVDIYLGPDTQSVRIAPFFLARAKITQALP